LKPSNASPRPPRIIRPLREAIVALVDTAAERVMDEVKDESPSEGFDEGVMTLAAAVAADLSIRTVERPAK
jgi:hypothetical protein